MTFLLPVGPLFLSGEMGCQDGSMVFNSGCILNAGWNRTGGHLSVFKRSTKVLPYYYFFFCLSSLMGSSNDLNYY